MVRELSNLTAAPCLIRTEIHLCRAVCLYAGIWLPLQDTCVQASCSVQEHFGLDQADNSLFSDRVPALQAAGLKFNVQSKESVVGDPDAFRIGLW